MSGLQRSRQLFYRGKDLHAEQNAKERSLPPQEVLTDERVFLEGIPKAAKILFFGETEMRLPNLLREMNPTATIDLLDGDRKNLEDSFPKDGSWRGKAIVSHFLDFDGLTIPKTEKYDSVFARRSLFFLEGDDLKDALKNIYMSLKPNGTLYFDFVAPCEQVKELTLIHPMRDTDIIDMAQKLGFEIERGPIYGEPHYPRAGRELPTNTFYLRKPK